MTQLSDMVQYQSREYCQAVGCETQSELKNYEKGTPEYESVKRACKDSCRKTAWEFHDWLQKQGFIIVKKE